MYDLILFDLDGTLLDSDEMIVETFKELYQIFKPDYHPTREHMLTFSGPQITVTLKNEFPDLDQEVVLNEFRKRSVGNYVKYCKLFPYVKEMFEKLNEKGIHFGIVTNKHRYATDYTYELFHVTGLVPYTVCADEVKHLKPAEDGVVMAMDHFGVKDKEKVLYVGDGQIDYLTAKNAGVKFAFVDWSTRKLPEGAKIDVHIKNYQQFLEEIL
ncbi:MAG: HAD family hydrolase [Bacilli bacterium]|nr:HAD family hydrolase [Bacilli bacterium]